MGVIKKITYEIRCDLCGCIDRNPGHNSQWDRSIQETYGELQLYLTVAGNNHLKHLCPRCHQELLDFYRARRDAFTDIDWGERPELDGDDKLPVSELWQLHQHNKPQVKHRDINRRNIDPNRVKALMVKLRNELQQLGSNQDEDVDDKLQRLKPKVQAVTHTIRQQLLVDVLNNGWSWREYDSGVEFVHAVVEAFYLRVAELCNAITKTVSELLGVKKADVNTAYSDIYDQLTDGAVRMGHHLVDQLMEADTTEVSPSEFYKWLQTGKQR